MKPSPSPCQSCIRTRSPWFSFIETVFSGSLFLFFLGLIWATACRPEDPTSSKPLEVAVRIGFEPDRLNPMLSRQVQATQIESRIFHPLMDYNPITLKFEPILIVEEPEIKYPQDGPYRGGVSYSFEILDDARWDDSTELTGYDYEFTMKAALNPYLVNTAWMANMTYVEEIVVDSIDPKKVTVYTNKPYILSEEVITSNPVYPRHIYDSASVLSSFRFHFLKHFDPASDQKTDGLLRNFAATFNDEKFSRTIVSGAGPYYLSEWVSNQQIVLKRKENWWGEKWKNRHPFMWNYPQKITYYLIADLPVAITALRDGRIDIISDLPPEKYDELLRENQDSGKLLLEAPPVLQYYYVAYNNDHPILSDSAVRIAFSHLMNIPELIDRLFYKQAIATTGPISPLHEAYDHQLSPPPFDPQKANELLQGAGWTDSNNDGILDKEIQGNQKNLSLRILTSRMQLSQDVALLLQEQAKKIRVELIIEPMEMRNLIQEVRLGNYDMACLASTQEIGPYDPYGTWHSHNAVPNGSNYCRFRNAEADRIIEKIQVTLEKEERNKLYAMFQKIIWQQQPALFLVAPRTCLAASSRLTFQSTSLRPGYFENTFRLK